jgi:hypothetical protein
MRAEGSWENKHVSPARQLPFKKYLKSKVSDVEI